MKKTLKTAFLYVGTIIGAGFSSGREIALYFKDLAPYNVAISAVFIGLFALLFLTAGRLRLIPKGKPTRLLVFLSASISLTSMLAGGEYVMYSMSHVPLLALVMALLGAVVVSGGIEKIKIANTILVPLIVVAIAVIFFKIPHESGTAKFSILRPLTYSGLDVLLGGIIVGSEGEDMSFKETLLSSLLITVFLAFMLYMLQTIVIHDKNDSLMPVFAISSELGLQAICGVLIASAIFTTLVSSLKIASDYLIFLCSKNRRLLFLATAEFKPVVVMFCLVVFYPLSFFGFKKIVGTLYPVNSVIGILIAFAVLLKIIAYSALKTKRKMLPNIGSTSSAATPRRVKFKNNISPRPSSGD